MGTIEVPTHTKLVSKPICILYLNTTKPFPKQPIELVCVIVVNLDIPPDNVKQHHPKIGEMIIDETLAQAQVQDLTIASWTVTNKE
jgi:hypothetical protein